MILELLDASGEKLRRSGFQCKIEWVIGFESNVWPEAQKFDCDSCWKNDSKHKMLNESKFLFKFLES